MRAAAHARLVNHRHCADCHRCGQARRGRKGLQWALTGPISQACLHWATRCHSAATRTTTGRMGVCTRRKARRAEHVAQTHRARRDRWWKRCGTRRRCSSTSLHQSRRYCKVGPVLRRPHGPAGDGVASLIRRRGCVPLTFLQRRPRLRVCARPGMKGTSAGSPGPLSQEIQQRLLIAIATSRRARCAAPANRRRVWCIAPTRCVWRRTSWIASLPRWEACSVKCRSPPRDRPRRQGKTTWTPRSTPRWSQVSSARACAARSRASPRLSEKRATPASTVFTRRRTGVSPRGSACVRF